MDTDKIFEYLKEFKNFPTYQFERRIDAFLLPYLSKAINQRFNLNDSDLVFVYPEFPLMRINIEEEKYRKQSDYADYLLWSKKLNTVYLVELKTDINSIHDKQFKTYLFNCELGWDKLIDYYIFKAKDNDYWQKFVYGLLHIEKKAPELMGGEFDKELTKYLTTSRGVHEYLGELRNLISFKVKPKVQFLYIAPIKAKEELEKYKSQIQSSNDFYLGLLTINKFADSTEGPLLELLKNIDK